MFGETVRSQRRSLGLTQEQLAEVSGLGLRTIRDIETGRIRSPRASTVTELATAFALEGADRARFHQAAAVTDGPPPAPRPTPAQLPAEIGAFAGRTEHLRLLDEYAAGPAATVRLATVSGTAGVGKTSLAVHWAYRMADRYPDGQLFVNLRGFDPQHPPIPAAEALRGFLDALDVPADRIPADLDARVALYRSLLAGRRMLILLDNAQDAGQVRPLLPGSPGSLVVVTSRNRLTGLVATEAARPILLDVLTPGESWQLLAERLGEARLLADPEAVTTIIAACGRLPLALAIVAARAAAEPSTPLRSYADELGDGASLSALTVGDPAIDVRAVFSWSYQAISPAAGRLFRLLGLHPGQQTSIAAAASLGALPVEETRQLLRELEQATLISQLTPGRYALHDLLREYATELTGSTDTQTDRFAAQHRLLDHYLRSADNAVRALIPFRDEVGLPQALPGVTADVFDNPQGALAWFALEYPTLLLIVDRAEQLGLDELLWHLCWAIAPYLNQSGRPADRASTQRAALEAARRLEDLPKQARSHRTLARAYRQLGKLEEALEQLDSAMKLATLLGDGLDQARTHIEISHHLCDRGRYGDGLRHAVEGLQLYRRAGHPFGEAYALNSIAVAHLELGDNQQALEYADAARARFEAVGTGTSDGAAATLDTLGVALHRLGRHDEAVRTLRQSANLHSERKNRNYIAEVLEHLGDACYGAGDRAGADDAWQRAIAILDDIAPARAQSLRDRVLKSPPG